MFLMTSCVTSARELAAEASLHRSSVPMSLACSITASSAGCRFMRDLAASTTNHLLRKELIVQGHYHSVGAKPNCLSHQAHSVLLRFIDICRFSAVSLVSLYFYYCREA